MAEEKGLFGRIWAGLADFFIPDPVPAPPPPEPTPEPPEPPPPVEPIDFTPGGGDFEAAVESWLPGPEPQSGRNMYLTRIGDWGDIPSTPAGATRGLDKRDRLCYKWTNVSRANQPNIPKPDGGRWVVVIEQPNSGEEDEEGEEKEDGHTSGGSHIDVYDWDDSEWDDYIDSIWDDDNDY